MPSKKTNGHQDGYALGALETSLANIAENFRDYKDDTRLWRVEMGSTIEKLTTAISTRMDKHEERDETRFEDQKLAVEKLDRSRWYRLGYSAGGVAAVSAGLLVLRAFGYLGGH
jgi:hypothetical protein